MKQKLYAPVFILFFISWCAYGHKSDEIGPIQLAKTYSTDIEVREYLISEKLDGVRARWTGRELLTRNGHKLYPPAWFTKDWPAIAMDGELWTKRGDFQTIASIVLSETPDSRWREVKMMLFDLPSSDMPFSSRVAKMIELVSNTAHPSLVMIPQISLQSIEELEAKLDNITNIGGEGLMLHHKQALYQDGRSDSLLKAKRFEDDEAKVVAHVAGKGKLTGMMGALVVQTKDGMQFKIGSGFTNDDRINPPPIDSWITFKFYGRTQRGIPRFATFLRHSPLKNEPSITQP
ncbi:DNA ligase [Alteromonas ponticola]|uniref:DNA ligase n=1 Tax=Alteromonas aquimaris TaxID=2998417 RepID=A0ABT3P8Z4_9ALTE|nr:DNA ligase [Alteromonas aquimaris]MCW8109190.1 DNA ligase [Alteromonas aquimaris]